ncbi:toxin glutamine deamidase domain-containing protein [Kitasatospora sp. NPDC004615]|uniref:toxin glutamine deamidase domain-containing protein n=1 Tax=Kitasatospora sp. NPDC004615 TaxID=3364017 RepID=UPI0036B873C3
MHEQPVRNESGGSGRDNVPVGRESSAGDQGSVRPSGDDSAPRPQGGGAVPNLSGVLSGAAGLAGAASSSGHGGGGGGNTGGTHLDGARGATLPRPDGATVPGQGMPEGLGDTPPNSGTQSPNQGAVPPMGGAGFTPGPVGGGSHIGGGSARTDVPSTSGAPRPGSQSGTVHSGGGSQQGGGSLRPGGGRGARPETHAAPEQQHTPAPKPTEHATAPNEHGGSNRPHEQQQSHEGSNRPHESQSHEGEPRPKTTDGRRIDEPGGLKEPSEHDQKRIEDAVPRDEDGKPTTHPDPQQGDWVKHLNGDGPFAPGRNNNCADAALSFMDTYNGHPTAAAPRVENNGAGEKGGRDRIEQSLGGRFEHQGAGAGGHEKLQKTLLESGPGSQALIISTDGEGRSHAWNVVNHDGKIVYVDPQMGRTSDKPLYPGEGGLFAVPLGPNGAALHPTNHGANQGAGHGTNQGGGNTGNHQAGARPETTPKTEAPPKKEAPPKPETTPKPETSPRPEAQPKPETTPKPETDPSARPESDTSPRPEEPRPDEVRPDEAPGGRTYEDPSPFSDLEDKRHIPTLEEMQEIGRRLGIPDDQLPVMVFVPDHATVSTPFSEYGEGRVGNLSEAAGKHTIGKIERLKDGDGTAAPTVVSGMGGGAYNKGANGAPDVLVVNQRMNKNGFTQEHTIQHELGHHKQALDQLSIDKTQNNPALIEYHNILINEVKFHEEGKKPRLTYAEADGQGGLSSEQQKGVKRLLGLPEDANLAPGHYWDTVAGMPKNPNEQVMFDQLAEAAGKEPYSRYPKVKQNFAKAYLVEHLKAHDRAAAAAAAGGTTTGPAPEAAPPAQQHAPAAPPVPPPFAGQHAPAAPPVPPPFAGQHAPAAPPVPPPFAQQHAGSAPPVPPRPAQQHAPAAPPVPPPFTQRPGGAAPEVPPSSRPTGGASSTNPFGDEHAGPSGNRPTPEMQNPFGDEHAASSGHNSPASEVSNPFGDEHAASSGHNSPASEVSNPFGDEHANTSHTRAPESPGGLGDSTHPGSRPDSTPPGLRPDAEPAGLGGRKPLMDGQGLTPEGRKLLHQNPTGPSIVYPPSNSKGAHAGAAFANKFKFELSPELKEVSNHLPVKDGKTHQSEGSTASGKPNAKIKDHTFKAYVDPATLTLVEGGAGGQLREPLRNALGPDAVAYSGNKVFEEAAKLDYRSRPTMEQQHDRRQLLKDLADQNTEKGTWIDGDRVAGQLAGQGSAMEGVDRLLNGHGNDAGFPGVVLGEGHGQSATWPFLKDNMKQLKASGVDTLYLEALRDDAVQHDLDKYLDPNHKGPMPPTLQKAAARYDSSHGAKLTEVLEAAKANNVKVRAVDGYPARTINEDGGVHERARLMNSYAHDVISSDAANGGGKYVAVVGASHAHSTTGSGGAGRIPGTADLLGVPAVHLTHGSGTAHEAPPRASRDTPAGAVRLSYLPTPENHSPAGNPAAAHSAAPSAPGGLGPVHPDAQTPHGSSEHLEGQGPQHDQSSQHDQSNQHNQHEGTTGHQPANEHNNPGQPHEQPNHEQPNHEQTSHEQPSHEQPSHERSLAENEGGGPRHPATDGRPFDVEGGLKRPSEHDLKQLQDAVPHNADGTPQRHPDPMSGDWVKKLNGDGPGAPGRANNCADAALSVVDTYDGRPTVAAPRVEDNSVGEKGSRDRIEQSLGGKFEPLGKGQAGHDKLAQTLLENGHGSQAVIVSQDADGRAHAWNAMNHNGKIVYTDGQMGRTSHTPLYEGEGGVFALPLTPDRAPLHPSGPPAGTTDHQAGPKLDAERPNPAPGMADPPRPRIEDVTVAPRPEELASLHKNPSGPALIYPPAASPEALAKYKSDNKFNFKLDSRLQTAATELPHNDWGRRHSGTKTEDGKHYEVKVSPYSQSFKSHLDAPSLRVVNSTAAGAVLSPLGDELFNRNPDNYGKYKGNAVLAEAGSFDFRTKPNYDAQLERVNVLERLAHQHSQQPWNPVDFAQVRDRLDGQQPSALDGARRVLRNEGDYVAPDGMVLGEAHKESPSWKFLKDNMQGLKDSGVDTLYLEAIRDETFQRHLDTYLKPGGTMPENLGKMLREYDKEQKSPAGEGLYDMMLEAKAREMRVVAADGFPARMPVEGNKNEQRARLMNSYTYDVIQNDHGRQGKFVAVVGASHALDHTYTPGAGRIPGLAEMLGAAPVRLVTPTGHHAEGGTPSGDLRLGTLEPNAAEGHVVPVAPAQPGGLGGPSHERPNHEQSSHEQSNHEQSSRELPNHEQPNHEQSSREQSNREQPSHEQPNHEPPSHERSLGDHEGDGPRRPATDQRPFDVEGGLKRPSEHESKQLQDAVPHNADGSPQRHPDPSSGDWLKKLNGDGPGAPGRANNCADAALSLVDTYDGHPTVAASRTEHNSVGEKGGRDRIEQSLGGKFEHLGSGPAGHDKLAQTLLDSGHGSQAVIISRDSEGRTHAWNAMNHNGKIVYADPQLGRTSDRPLYAGEGGLFAVPLTPDRAPLHPSGPPAGTTGHQAGGPRPAHQPGGEELRPGASPGATEHAGSSQHTDGAHQAEQQQELHGDGEHPPVTPEPLPPVGTPEHGIMHDPAEFLKTKQVSVDFAAGVKERMPRVRSEEAAEFLEAIKGRDQHWFVLEPNGQTKNGEPSGYHLVPAWEKYAAHYEGFPRPDSGLPPVKADHEYVKGAYIPYKSEERPDPSRPDTIGHTEVPLNPHPDLPREGLVFTDAMNGCALVTTVEPGKGTFTAWHFQSYSSAGHLEGGYKFREQHTVTSWMGVGDYSHPLPLDFKPAATNMLKHGPNGWEMISQESHTYGGNSEAMKKFPPTLHPPQRIPFDVATQDPRTVVKMTLDPYHVIAQERLDRFQKAAHDLTTGLDPKNRALKDLQPLLSDMNDMLGAQNDLVKAYQRSDATLEDLQQLSNGLNRIKRSRQMFLDEHRAEIERLAVDATPLHPNRSANTVLSEFGYSIEPGKPDWVDHMASDVAAQIKKRDDAAQQPPADPAGVSSPRPPADPAGVSSPQSEHEPLPHESLAKMPAFTGKDDATANQVAGDQLVGLRTHTEQIYEQIRTNLGRLDLGSEGLTGGVPNSEVQYNLWSGNKKMVEQYGSAELTGEGQAENSHGFMMSRTEEHQRAIRELNEFYPEGWPPPDPGYQKEFIGWLKENEKQGVAYDPEAIQQKFSELRAAAKDRAGELLTDEGVVQVGEHGARFQNAWDRASDDVAMHAALAMAGFRSFGLDEPQHGNPELSAHPDPKSTVQVRQEIPMAERIANEVAADLHDNVKARRQVADLAQDPELKAELHRLANRAEQGAKHFTEGAEQLKWEESTTREERAELAERRKHSAETMLRGRDEFLSAARDFDQALGKLGVPAAHSDYVSDVRPPADPGGLGEHQSHERSVGEHEGGSQPRPDASPGAAPDGGPSQHTDGEHQGGNDAHGNDAHGNDAQGNDAQGNDAHGNDTHDGAEHDGAEHPPVVPEPLPPVGTPEHGIMHDPRTFLEENLVAVDFAAGARQRMPGLKPFEENTLLKAMRGRDQHWFEMVPNPSAAASGKAGYYLVPAWEKYAEHYADFPRPSGGLPPVKEDSHYVRGAYVPYEADKRASLADLSTIGHTEVPLHPNPARPREGLVFTDAMNGCAFVATVEPGRDTFTAWHYQSYSASDALRTAAEFRAAQTVTTWMGGGDYAAVLPPGHTPAATNMLRYGPDGWEMVSQEVQKDARNPLNPPRVSRQSTVPFEVGTQTPEAVVKMTVDPYLINAKEQLGHFDDAAYGLTKDLSLTNPHVRSLNQRMGQMREMLLEQKNLVEALQRPDASLEDIQSAAAELRAKSEEKRRFLALHENHIRSLANQVLTDYPNRTTATLFSEFGKSDWIGVMTDDAGAQIQKRDAAAAQQLAESGPIGDPAGAPQERAFEPVPDDDPRALKLAGYVGGPGNVHPPMSNTLLGHVNPRQAPEQDGTGFRPGPELNASVENVEAYRDTHFGRPRVSGDALHGDAAPATGSTPWTRPEAPAAFGKGDDAVKALMEKVQAGGKGSFATVLGAGEEGRAHAVALVHDRDGRLRWADLTARRVSEATGGMPSCFGLGWNLWASVSDPEENTISGPQDPQFTETFGAFTAPGREH